LFHPTELIIAVRPTDRENKNGVLWNSKPIAASNLCKNLYTFCSWQEGIRYKIMADYFIFEDEKLIMFDLSSAEFFIKESVEKSAIDENGEAISIWKEISRLLQPEKWQEDFGRDMVSHATTCRRWLAMTLDDWQTAAAAENVQGFDGFISTETMDMVEDEFISGFAALFETESANLRLTGGAENAQ